MAKGKKKLNKTNSSGWLDDYSEEFSIDKYQEGGKVNNEIPNKNLQQYFKLPTKRVAVDNTYNKNSPIVNSSDDKEMVNNLLREKANQSQKAKEKRIADVRRLEELNQKSMLETANAKDLYDIGEGMKSKYRFSNENNFFDDYINPFNIVGGVAGRLAQTPELINQGDYTNAALALAAPLGIGAIGSIGANTAKQFLNNTFNPVAASHITHTPALVASKIAAKKTLQKQGASTYANGGIIDNIKEFFVEKTNKVINKSAPEKNSPKTFKIEDKRKVLATSGNPIRPNVDLTSGEYDLDVLNGIIESAKRNKLSIEDAKNLAAIAFQETKFGKVDENLGHVFDNVESRSDLEALTNAYITKMKEADRLGIKDDATRLQVYNGLGVIKPSTEQDYHGFKMKKIYGVPVPNEGINMKKNPLYGKQIMDLRDNVLNQNPEYVNYLNTAYNSKNPVPIYSDIELKSWAPRPLLGKFQSGGKVNDNNGYLISNLDNFTPKKIINSNYITTNNMAFPVKANGVVLYPNTGDYVFPTDKVTEIPIMKDGGQHGGLDRWFAEKWVDVKTGKECGRQKGEKRKGYPACRPSKRISSDTPKTASELSSAEKEKFKREKTSSKRIDYIHKKEDGGLIYNDMKNKFKKYQGGGYLNYQDSFKGFGVGPQLYQDNSYFRSVMPDTIENMEEEINKPSVFSGINNILGSVNQGVNQITGLMSQIPQPTMGGNNVMPDISNWQSPLSSGKTDEQLNFENDQALKNAGLFNSFYPQKLPTIGSSMGPSMDSSTWKGVPFIKNGGYLRKYQNGGNMDMLPVGYPEYIHKSNVFHENYNPVPRVHFSDDTTPYDMGVNLNDLVNMYGGRVGKYQYGGMMPFYSRQRSPRVFNSNANRASAADLESAYANDFMHTKVRKDRQSHEDDKVDWGFMDWAKDPVAGYLGMMSTVPIVGDITKDIVGDSFLTRRSSYAIGKGIGNVSTGAAKVVGGVATGNVGLIGSGVGDVGEGVGSTIGTLQAKDSLANYDKSGYVSGNRMVNASQDFGNMMDTASSLYGNVSGGISQMKNLGGLKGMMGNMKGGATGMKGFGNIMGKITGFGQDGGYIDYNFNNIEEYKYGGKVSQKINKKQNKTGWLDQL